MKNYTPLKQQAITLRKRGFSYNEIKKKIPIAKSTLSLWLKTIPLKAEYRRRLYTKQISILSRGSQSQKERRAREITGLIERAKAEITLPLSLDTYRLMGAALYWAEGSKQNGFEITNSDPSFILFMVRWIEKMLNLPPEKLKARLNIYPQQNEKRIKQFWTNLTGIPITNFGKSYVKPISSGYKKNNLYYGTIRVEMPKGTDFRHRVFGWIQVALQDIEPKIKSVERRWVILKKSIRPANLPKPPIA